MGDSLGVVRAAVVQASSSFLNREETVDKTVHLIEEAGRRGAEVVVFPEGFIPTHPLWLHFHAATSAESLRYAAELFRNAVVIGGKDTDRIAEASRRAKVWSVVGVCEKRQGTTGTLWNSAVHFAPDGSIAAVHRKLTPTVGERLVHTGGDGAGLIAPRARFGPISSLICAENSNPLLTFSASAQYSVLHAALWPNHFSPTQPRMRDVILNSSRAIAYQGGCYVLNAAGTLQRSDVDRIARSEEDAAWLSEDANLGGSCIVSPSGEVLAGQAGAEETILVADLDLDVLIGKRAIHDFAGHYNRSDILSLTIAAPPTPILQAPWMRSSRQGETTSRSGIDAPAPGLLAASSGFDAITTMSPNEERDLNDAN